LKHPNGGGKEYLTPPLLVMNNFITPPPQDGSSPAVPKHLESLTTTIFQSLFPPISPQSTPLSSIRRVLVLNRELSKPSSSSLPDDNGSYNLNLRHYAITTKRIGLSRGIRRLNAAEKMLHDRKNKRSLPNLGKLEDVSDYLLDPSAAAGGFTSGSESEVETDAEVEVLDTSAKKVLSKQQMAALRRSNSENGPRRQEPGVEKRAVKLVELGPRLKLRMTKVEEGVCGGKVMWHEYLNKSKEEEKEMEKVWEGRRKQREERKRVQRENVERKKKEKGSSKKEGVEEEKGDMVMDEEGYEDEWDSEGLEGDGEMKTNEMEEAG